VNCITGVNGSPGLTETDGEKPAVGVHMWSALANASTIDC